MSPTENATSSLPESTFCKCSCVQKFPSIHHGHECHGSFGLLIICCTMTLRNKNWVHRIESFLDLLKLCHMHIPDKKKSGILIWSVK